MTTDAALDQIAVKLVVIIKPEHRRNKKYCCQIESIKNKTVFLLLLTISFDMKHNGGNIGVVASLLTSIFKYIKKELIIQKKLHF